MVIYTNFVPIFYPTSFLTAKGDYPKPKCHSLFRSTCKIGGCSQRVLQNLTAYILESIQLFAKDLSWFKGRIQYNGLDEIRRCLSSSSVIVIGSHMGNWEWSAVLFPPMTQLPAYAVYKPLSNKSLDVPVKASRSRFGLGLLNMKEVIRFMHKNTILLFSFFVSDQSPADVTSGSWHTF